MTLEELEEKRKFSLKAVLTLGISAVPIEFWSLDTNLIRGTSLDKGALGFMLRIFLFIVLTVPFMLVFFIINLIKLIYYQIEISKYKEIVPYDIEYLDMEAGVAQELENQNGINYTEINKIEDNVKQKMFKGDNKDLANKYKPNLNNDKKTEKEEITILKYGDFIYADNPISSKTIKHTLYDS